MYGYTYVHIIIANVNVNVVDWAFIKAGAVAYVVVAIVSILCSKLTLWQR